MERGYASNREIRFAPTAIRSMSETIDPSEMVDETVIGEPEPQAEPAGGLTSHPIFSTEPSVPISEIEHTESVPTWAAYLIRCGYKLTGSHGTPAIVDGGMGAVLAFLNFRPDGSGGSPNGGDSEGFATPETEEFEGGDLAVDGVNP